LKVVPIYIDEQQLIKKAKANRREAQHKLYEKYAPISDDGEIAPTDTINNIKSELEVSHIQRLIDRLPEGYRVVFVMYAIEGYKHREIADTLGISVSTSKTQLFKARKQLQEALAKENKLSYGTH